MGCFDSAMVPCPECGTVNEFQSKGGACNMRRYTLENAPVDVLGDANRHDVECDKCGTAYKIAVRCIATAVRTADYVDPAAYDYDANDPECWIQSGDG